MLSCKMFGQCVDRLCSIVVKPRITPGLHPPLSRPGTNSSSRHPLPVASAPGPHEALHTSRPYTAISLFSLLSLHGSLPSTHSHTQPPGPPRRTFLVAAGSPGCSLTLGPLGSLLVRVFTLGGAGGVGNAWKMRPLECGRPGQ